MLFFNSGYANDNRFHLHLQPVLTKNKKWVHKLKKGGVNQLCTTVKDQKNERPVHNHMARGYKSIAVYRNPF